ncbi:hypothetical protein ACFOWM_05995 [Ferruginibacter yonginensis]|uniref:Uncharacterized protein n=1 Tax=Ferruginibacter yonginensis TaxID=1310416 RepID=A0ABV8QRN1_9BACT
MNEQQQAAAAIEHINTMMERSSRFISLSGWSGISAGICALVGAWLAYPYTTLQKSLFINERLATEQLMANSYAVLLNTWLFYIALGTFVMAFATAFIFTWRKSKQQGVPLWGSTAKRLMINVSVPLLVGAIFLMHMVGHGTLGLVAPGCLIFYGLALVNASKYTLHEIRYLGYAQIILGIVNCWFEGYGLYFWALGFGIMHIAYGIYMWATYEKNTSAS